MVRLHEGVRLVTGGKAINGLGYFIQPTVLADVTDVMAFSWRQIEISRLMGARVMWIRQQDVKTSLVLPMIPRVRSILPPSIAERVLRILGTRPRK